MAMQLPTYYTVSDAPYYLPPDWDMGGGAYGIGSTITPSADGWHICGCIGCDDGLCRTAPGYQQAKERREAFRRFLAQTPPPDYVPEGG